MIPQNHITAWRAYAPWSNDAQVEQDLIISRVLIEIYSNSVLSNELAFRGGTALHKLFLTKPFRYSEDIDLVQIKAGPNGHIIDAMRSILDSWLGSPKRKIKADKLALTYSFDSEIPPITPMRLKIEINTCENFSVEGFQKKLFEITNPWFSGKTRIVTYTLEELLGTKLRALYQRKKGRDLFDLSTFIEQINNIKLENMINCFRNYTKQSGVRISRAEFEENLSKKIIDPAFIKDVEPLISPYAPDFDAKSALNYIVQHIISMLPGEQWKGKKEK